MLCPICRGIPDHLARTVSFDRVELSLVRQLNPLWTDNDCICERCVRTIRAKAQRLRERQARPAQADGFRHYVRFHLSRVDTGHWNHGNPEIASWHRRRIADRIAAETRGDPWVLFDCDEKVIEHRCIPAL